MFSLLENKQIFIVVLLADEVIRFLCQKEYQKMVEILIFKYYQSFSSFLNFVHLMGFRKKDFHHQLFHERNYLTREPLKNLALYFQFNRYYLIFDFILFEIFTFF